MHKSLLIVTTQHGKEEEETAMWRLNVSPFDSTPTGHSCTLGCPPEDLLQGPVGSLVHVAADAQVVLVSWMVADTRF